MPNLGQHTIARLARLPSSRLAVPLMEMVARVCARRCSISASLGIVRLRTTPPTDRPETPRLAPALRGIAAGRTAVYNVKAQRIEAERKRKAAFEAMSPEDQALMRRFAVLGGGGELWVDAIGQDPSFPHLEAVTSPMGDAATAYYVNRRPQTLKGERLAAPS